MKTFETKEELLNELKKMNACKSGIKYVKSCSSLEEVIDKCPLNYRIWALIKGFVQFEQNFNWDKLDGKNWAELLSAQPKFAKFCNWSKLNNTDWYILLIKRPRFIRFCDISKLSNEDLNYLLINKKFTKFINKLIQLNQLNQKHYENIK